MNVSRRAASPRGLTLWTIAAAVTGTLLLTAEAQAQVATATILGNVTDTSGGAVPGAQVTATNLDTQFSRDTTTDTSGQYALRLLPLGHYKVDVKLDGFKNFSHTQRPYRRHDRAWQRR